MTARRDHRHCTPSLFFAAGEITAGHSTPPAIFRLLRLRGLFQLSLRIYIGRLYILIVTVSTHLQLLASCLVGHDERLLMHLESRDSPHLADAALHAMMKRTALVVAVDDKQHAAGRHDRAHTYRESSLRHEIDIVVEEA